MGGAPSGQDKSSAGRGSGRAILGRSAASRLVLVVVALALGLAVFVVARGFGGEAQPTGPLAWAGEPRVQRVPVLPSDRVLSGRVRNDSLRRVRIEAREVRVQTADGEPVQGSASFVSGFIHGLYPPTREPRELAESELRRIGRLAVIEPGQTVPLTLAWRLEAGKPPPTRLDYGEGSLAIPR